MRPDHDDHQPRDPEADPGADLSAPATAPDGGAASIASEDLVSDEELERAAGAVDAAGDADTADAEGPTEQLSDEALDAVVEALLFAAGEPLIVARIAQAAGNASPRRVKSSIERLRRTYHAQGRAFDILEIAGGLRLYSRPEFQPYVARLDKARAPEKLTAAALETLAIVAYRQPIVRADIDAIRGVNSSALLKSLMERKLIRAVGRADRPGRPMEYGTTRRFLDHFGLASVKDLPRVEDLKSP